MGKVLEKKAEELLFATDQSARSAEIRAGLRPRPKEEISAEEAEIRKAEVEEEKRLQAVLDAAVLARADAEADLAALEKKSKSAGATSYFGVMGISTDKNADELVQKQCRAFFPIAEGRVEETRETERKAQILLNSARTAHANRKTRNLMLKQRQAEKELAAAKEQELRDRKTARILAMKEFLKS